MSGFLLWWHRGGAELDAGARARVGTALAARHPGAPRWRLDPGCAAVQLAWPHGWDPTGAMPHQAGSWLIAGEVRLDDRATLVEQLARAGHAVAPGAPDAALLGVALAAWGADAPDRLLGDYAFVALDTGARRLVAARGTTGVVPLFRAESTEWVALSNDLDALLALPSVTDAVDEGALVDFLHAGAMLSPDRTARRAARRVPPGSALAWEPSGGARVRASWRLPEPALLRLRDPREYGDGFRAVLEAAVADRIRGGSAGILLSGGLDSSAIAAALRATVPPEHLWALTISAEHLVATDEAAWAGRVARHLALPNSVSADDPARLLAHLDDATLRTPEPVDEPDLAGWRTHAAQLATFAPVAFEGEDGDALLAPPDLVTMLRRGGWIETLRAWRAYRAATGRRPWIGLRSTPGQVRSRIRRALRPPPWLQPRALRVHGSGVPPFPPPHPTRPVAALSLAQPAWEALFAVNDRATTGAPLRVVLPLLDPRVIAFAFAVPPIPWCQRKELLRASMQDRLPAEVLARPKTPLSGAGEAAVAAWRARGGAERPLRHDLSAYVDQAEWRRALRGERGVDAVIDAWRVLELDRWLSQPAAG